MGNKLPKEKEAIAQRPIVSKADKAANNNHQTSSSSNHPNSNAIKSNDNNNNISSPPTGLKTEKPKCKTIPIKLAQVNMLYIFINKAVDDLNSLNKRSLNVLSHSPPSPSESLGIINSGNSPEYAHFNNKLTINDFDLLKVKFAISPLLLSPLFNLNSFAGSWKR